MAERRVLIQAILAGVIYVLLGVSSESGMSLAIAPLAVAGIGAGLGLLGGLFGPKERRETQTTTYDPATLRALQQYRRNAGGLFDQFSSGYLNPALQGYQRTAGDLAGNLGFASERGLGGIESYFNPFEQAVVGGVQSDFDRQRQMGQNTAADLATKGGAFGGSRDAILRAQSLRDVNQAETGTLANLRYGGFSDAASRLAQDRAMAANLGMAGFQGLGNLGQFMDQRTLEALRLQTPGLMPGSTTTTGVTPYYRNPIAGALGGASTALGMFGGGMPGFGTPGGPSTNMGWPAFGQSFNPRQSYLGGRY